MARVIRIRPAETIRYSKFLLDMVWRGILFELLFIAEQGLRGEPDVFTKRHARRMGKENAGRYLACPASED